MITTDKYPEQKLNLSSRKRRLVAFIIDQTLVISVFFLFKSFISSSPFEEINLGKIIRIMLVSVLFINLLYSMKDSFKGISIGRWIMGIMVRNSCELDKTPSFSRLFIRNLFMIISPIECIILVLSLQKKRLGDIITKTVVVNNPDKLSKKVRILVLLGMGMMFFMFSSLTAKIEIKNSNPYKVAIKEIQQNQEILNETGGIKGYGVLPLGNISILDGYGQARLEITVLGNDNDLHVVVSLTKLPNLEWKADTIEK